MLWLLARELPRASRAYWSTSDFLVGVLLMCQSAVVIGRGHYPAIWPAYVGARGRRRSKEMKSFVAGLAAILIGGLSVVPAGATEGDEDAARDAALAEGRALTAQFLAGDVDLLWPRFGEQLRNVIGSPAGLQGFSTRVREQLGTERAVLAETVQRQGDVTVYRRIGRWALAPMPIAVTWAIGPEGRIEGFQVAPAPPEEPAADLPQAPLPPGHLPDDETVASRLQAFVAQPGAAPGVVVGLHDAQGTRYLAWGDVGDGEAPDADTVFEAGSITKGLTGLLLAQMAASGDVRTDQAIGGLVPEDIELAPELAAITLAELATHSSGLPRLATGPEMQARMTSDDPYAGSTPEELFADLARVAPGTVQAGRGRFAYSNLGMALLGQLLARSAGESYDALLAERVFAPLGLRAPVLEPGAVTTRRALGAQAGKPVPAWRLDAYAPAGAWQASARDLVALGRRLLLAEPAWVATALERRELAGHPGAGMGLGWHHANVGDREIVWHNGGTAGCSSFLAVVPAEGLVVTVLANGGGGVVDGLARGLLASGR